MTIILNGARVRLTIPRIFDGFAGRQGNRLSFPVSKSLSPRTVDVTIDGAPARVSLNPTGWHPTRNPFVTAIILD